MLSEVEIVDQIDRISKICTLAAHSLGKSRWDIEVEAVYTQNVLKFLEQWEVKFSFNITVKLILAEIQKYWTIDHYTDFSWVDDVEEALPSEIDQEILKKANAIKELVGEQWYERMTSYYNSIKGHKSCNGTRDKKRGYETLSMYRKKVWILKKISNSPELQKLFA